MTTKTRPCALCRRRPRIGRVESTDLCETCYAYAGWENTHSDDDHDGLVAGHGTDSPVSLDAINVEMTNCPICRGVPAPWTITEETPVKTTTAPKSRRDSQTRHMSHASCSHPRTPAGRAVCRKAIRGALGSAPATKPSHVTLGKSTTVHVPGGCTTTRKHDGAVHRTDDDVTCKSCLKTLATVDA